MSRYRIAVAIAVAILAPPATEAFAFMDNAQRSAGIVDRGFMDGAQRSAGVIGRESLSGSRRGGIVGDQDDNTIQDRFERGRQIRPAGEGGIRGSLRDALGLGGLRGGRDGTGD